MKQKTKRLFLILAVCAVSVLAVFAGGCKTVSKWKDKFDQLRCEHEWTDGVVTTEATCETDGTLTRLCTKCDKAKKEKIPALGHDLTAYAGQAAKCVEIGWEDYESCSRCDYTTYTEIGFLGHKLSAVVLNEPTCEGMGIRQISCSACEYIEHVDIPAKGHNLSSEVITEPTCEEKGLQHTTCSECEYLEEVEIEAKGHNYCSVILTEPTCEGTGVRRITCSECEYLEEVEIEAKGHSGIEDSYEMSAPTCTTPGHNEYMCTECYQLVSVPVPALGGEHEFGELQCGSTSDFCDKCGKYLEVEITEDTPVVHWAIPDNPYVCAGCGKSMESLSSDPYVDDEYEN